LIGANLIKTVGAVLLLCEVEALLAYAVVGLGAALYSPAKYGILPELLAPERLVKANSWMEGATILAILTGMLAGGHLADYSIPLALLTIGVLFLVSAVVTAALPRLPARTATLHAPFARFLQQCRAFWPHARARFVLLGGAVFWASAATLRVILVAWAPEVLGLHSASGIAQLTLFLAIGIVAGAALVPRLIPLEQLRRAQFPAFAMALLITLLSACGDLWTARLALWSIGVAGGMFIVPLNAALQDWGQHTLGSGGAVALQNFLQNAAMLLAVGLYTLAQAHGATPTASLFVLGVLVIALCVLIVGSLPRPARTPRTH